MYVEGNDVGVWIAMNNVPFKCLICGLENKIAFDIDPSGDSSWRCFDCLPAHLRAQALALLVIA